MTATIDTPTDAPFFDLRARLDGTEYLLTFRYMVRTERFVMSLYSEQGEPVVEGIKLVANWPLLRYYKHLPNCPQGELVVVDLSQDGTPPKLGELGLVSRGQRCELTYFSPGELAEIAG